MIESGDRNRPSYVYNPQQVKTYRLHITVRYSLQRQNNVGMNTATAISIG